MPESIKAAGVAKCTDLIVPVVFVQFMVPSRGNGPELVRMAVSQLS